MRVVLPEPAMPMMMTAAILWSSHGGHTFDDDAAAASSFIAVARWCMMTFAGVSGEARRFSSSSLSDSSYSARVRKLESTKVVGRDIVEVWL